MSNRGVSKEARLHMLLHDQQRQKHNDKFKESTVYEIEVMPKKSGMQSTVDTDAEKETIKNNNGGFVRGYVKGVHDSCFANPTDQREFEAGERAGKVANGMIGIVWVDAETSDTTETFQHGATIPCTQVYTDYNVNNRSMSAGGKLNKLRGENSRLRSASQARADAHDNWKSETPSLKSGKRSFGDGSGNKLNQKVDSIATDDQEVHVTSMKPLLSFDGSEAKIRPDNKKPFHKPDAEAQMLKTIELYKKVQKLMGKTLYINDGLVKATSSRAAYKKKGWRPGSMHFSGKAIDISLHNLTPKEQLDLVDICSQCGFNAFGFGRSFLHVDTRSYKTAWPYTAPDYGGTGIKASAMVKWAKGGGFEKKGSCHLLAK